MEEIEKDLEKARRVAIDPRILTAAKLVGEVDLRAGGKTLVDPDLLQDGGVLLPKEWAAVGDVSLSYKQLADKEQRIKDAFLVPMLELFAYDEGKKGFPTATEVMARENQYLLQFFRLSCSLPMMCSRRWTGCLWCCTGPGFSRSA